MVKTFLIGAIIQSLACINLVHCRDWQGCLGRCIIRRRGGPHSAFQVIRSMFLPPIRPLLTLCAASLTLAGCATPMSETNIATPSVSARAVSPILTTADAVDTASFARPQVARVTHVALDLDLDFAARRVGGTATLDILAADTAQEIILDDRGLEITSITDDRGNALRWTVGAAVEGTFSHYRGGNGLTPIRMGNTNHGRLAHCGVLPQHAFDLSRIDVHTT